MVIPPYYFITTPDTEIPYGMAGGSWLKVTFWTRWRSYELLVLSKYPLRAQDTYATLALCYKMGYKGRKLAFAPMICGNQEGE